MRRVMSVTPILVLVILIASVSAASAALYEIAKTHAEFCGRLAAMYRKYVKPFADGKRYDDAEAGHYDKLCAYGTRVTVPLFQREINDILASAGEECYDDVDRKVLASVQRDFANEQTSLASDCQKAAASSSQQTACAPPDHGVVVSRKPTRCGNETSGQNCTCLALRNTCPYLVTIYYRFSRSGKLSMPLDHGETDNRTACSGASSDTVEYLGFAKRPH